uniref:Hydrophobic seed protein domain-containing protein n=1 Tax=Setaria viridis TaxID=4556 RepID=A0A4U6TRD0_SETVI|nr:hypothetical protein SEVIR_7G077950v2 [Setaria viridis]
MVVLLRVVYLLFGDGCFFKIVMSAGTEPHSCCSNGILIDIACTCSLM